MVNRKVTQADFDAARIDNEVALTLGSANTAADGVVRGVRESGAEPVPLLFTEPKTAGQITVATLHDLIGEVVAAIAAAGQLDGIVLALHGGFSARVPGNATTVEFGDDVDGDLLVAVRDQVGPNVPITASLDMHSNLSKHAVASVDALCIIRTYPHVDAADRGVQAATIGVSAVRGEVRPITVWRPLPLLWSAGCMIDASPPMAAIRQRVEELQDCPAVLAAGVHTGYQWVDNPTVGAGVVVTTNGNSELAVAKMDCLARWVWEQRERLLLKPVSPATALTQADRVGRYPTVFADQADNTGGGAPGDSTEVLQLFIDRNLRDALVLYMVDPEIAELSHRRGIGAVLDIALGGKSSLTAGPATRCRAEVVGLTSGEFGYDGPMWCGKRSTMGPSTWLRIGGVSVVVTSLRSQPVDTAFCRTLGIDVAAFRYIAVKSTGHFRSGFGPIAAQIFNVDAAGPLSHNFSAISYSRLRGVYPLDENATPNWATV